MGKIMINDINFSGGGPQIDDTTTSNSTTWSSNQTNTEITKVAHNSADEYDSARTSSNKYNKGDLCIYQNTLYKCNADAGTYGPFDSSKWSSTTLSDELDELKSDLSHTNSKIDFLRSRFYLGNYTSFNITLPDTRQGGDNFNHMTMIIGNNAFAILCCAYSQNSVSVVSLGSNTITATKQANSFNITVNFNDTSWGGIRVITLD